MGGHDSANRGEHSAPHVEPVDFDPAPIGDEGFQSRYRRRRTLGRGGMGEVQACTDSRIGREVAMKVFTQGSDEQLERFVREARVQGQLEHPAVVPVYDLGQSPHGASFFTMKRVRGETLRDVLKRLRHGEEEAERQHSRRRLLTAFSSVCLAIDFAHQRRVVHGDLKPGNVMLGQYGEVYVLDWGAALPLGEKSPTGKVIGTPGFMAPEQLRGHPVDERTDVYALGAILFEMLTLLPLHARRSADEAIASTKAGADARASVRTPGREVPPELETICVRATATDPDARYPSARALHEAVEQFLDGDRDLELRRRMSQQHAERAELDAQRALSGDDDDALGARRSAMREVSRALALDPDNGRAMQTMARLLLEPPSQTPPEVRREMTGDEADAMRRAGRVGALVYASFLLFLPFVLSMGVLDWTGVVLSIVLILSTAGLMLGTSFAPQRRRGVWATLGLSTLAVGGLSYIFGPYVLVPAVAAANTMAYVMLVRRRGRAVAIALGSLAVLLPAALEWVGLLPPAYAFEGGAMTIVPRSHPFPETATTAFLLGSSVALIAISALFSGWFRDALDDARRRLHVHAWHMRQFLQSE